MATALLAPPSSPCLSPASLFLKSSTRVPRSCSVAPFQQFKRNSHLKCFRVRALKEKTGKNENPSSSSSPSNVSAEEITQKYGLEAGLLKIFSSKEEGKEGQEKTSKGDEAKELLAKYGGPYLATSITLSIISFSLCYVLINTGVDVQALLQKVGISSNETGEKVGTFALTYAAHKAASPIRFPPTVALTPIYGRWLDRKDSRERKVNTAVTLFHVHDFCQ